MSFNLPKPAPVTVERELIKEDFLESLQTEQEKLVFAPAFNNIRKIKFIKEPKMQIGEKVLFLNSALSIEEIREKLKDTNILAPVTLTSSTAAGSDYPFARSF